MDFQNAWKKFVHPDLINGPIFKSIIAFTVPLTISYVFQQFYNAVDTVIIAHFLGEKSLAAMGACTSVYDLLVGFGLGFGNGMGIVAAKAFGSGEQKKLKKVSAKRACRAWNPGRNHGGVPFLHFDNHDFLRRSVRIQSFRGTFARNRELVHTAALPDFFVRAEHSP